MGEEDWIRKEYEKYFSEDFDKTSTSSNLSEIDLIHKARCKLIITNKVASKYLDEYSAPSILKDEIRNYADLISESTYNDKELVKFMKENNMTNNSFQFRSNIDNLNLLSKIPGLNKNKELPEEDLRNFSRMLKPKTPPKREPVNIRTRFQRPQEKPSTEVTSNKIVEQNKPGCSRSGFRTAKEELGIQNAKNQGSKRYLGGKRKNTKFVSPMLSKKEEPKLEEEPKEQLEEIDERLKNIDPKMVELIRSEIMDVGTIVNWNDIAGLEFAKTAIQEAVVWPMLRPDIFKGLRRPPKGILLFGPPGTGKTLIGKCVASQSKSTFFSISASSLTSKWIGDGEKMVRALFAVARCHQPAVIFIDEIDSLLSQRSDTEHESSRRIKTEFLVQLDGATTESEERLLVIGATNRPQELDEAARRRLVKRLYIPLPEFEARLQLVKKLMSTERNSLTDDNFRNIAELSDGYSGADMKNLCSDASLGPIRCINLSQIENIEADEVRPVSFEDFKKSLRNIRASVSQGDLHQYVVWDKTYGSGNV